MTKATFKRRLLDNGFDVISIRGVTTRFTRAADRQHVVCDNVRGAAWRCLLAVGSIPEEWPVIDVRDFSAGWIAAESPWFNYFTDLDPTDPDDSQFDDRETALDRCYNWLTTVGFLWLSNPHVKDDDSWRKEHNILIWPRPK